MRYAFAPLSYLFNSILLLFIDLVSAILVEDCQLSLCHISLSYHIQIQKMVYKASPHVIFNDLLIFALQYKIRFV